MQPFPLNVGNDNTRTTYLCHNVVKYEMWIQIKVSVGVLLGFCEGLFLRGSMRVLWGFSMGFVRVSWVFSRGLVRVSWEFF